MRDPAYLFRLLSAVFLVPVGGLAAGSLSVSHQSGEGGFDLASAGRAADLLVSKDDFMVVRIAAQSFASDIALVTGTRPRVRDQVQGLSENAVLIGTLGKSGIIDQLVSEGKLDAAGLRGQWESFMIATVRDPLPGIRHGLVIAGSDRRGTAFGVFTLSEAIGVSPWVWWADVPPVRRAALVVSGTEMQGPPSVKYRGIFINDEDWGLQPWAAKTFEPETGDIGPKTYARVFELLLRLKANYLWPAMHPSTKAFNHYPRNRKVADDCAIVMGSSHAEPMLRNNVDEWDEKVRGKWDYTANRDRVLKYWDERVSENASYENIYTVGMRGIHDSGMVGQKTVEERVATMEDIFAEQRAMLAKYVNPRPDLVPQNFVPYKEVLELYRHGLKVPDVITLVWVDDNHGYIRQLSNPEERKRGGGAGVYYHISYWGAPEDYLWICSTPPALVWEEMHKAWENGADRVWVLNVGDIKPAEIGMEFFLRMAWDISPWKEDAQPRFLAEWAARTFGPKFAPRIAAVLDEYYRLNFPAKPEHMHLAKFTDYYGERELRLKRFAALVKKADAIWTSLPKERRDSYFELVLYPIRGAALVNRMHLATQSADVLKAYDQLQAETTYYNEKLAGGKWRGMMSSNPRGRPALEKPKITTQEIAKEISSRSAFISFEAERPTRAAAPSGAAWKTISGLGRSGDSIALLPTTAGITRETALEYDFTLTKSAEAIVVIYSLPTHPLHSGVGARYAVNIDGGPDQTLDIATAEFSGNWSENVLRAAAIHTTQPIPLDRGRHTLTLRPLDPGLVFDKVVIDLGSLLPSHLGPSETPAAQ